MALLVFSRFKVLWPYVPRNYFRFTPPTAPCVPVQLRPGPANHLTQLRLQMIIGYQLRSVRCKLSIRAWATVALSSLWLLSLQAYWWSSFHSIHCYRTITISLFRNLPFFRMILMCSCQVLFIYQSLHVDAGGILVECLSRLSMWHIPRTHSPRGIILT